MFTYINVVGYYDFPSNVNTSSLTPIICTIPLDSLGGDGGDEEPPQKDKLLEKTCGEGPLPNVGEEKEDKEKNNEKKNRARMMLKGKDLL